MKKWLLGLLNRKPRQPQYVGQLVSTGLTKQGEYYLVLKVVKGDLYALGKLKALGIQAQFEMQIAEQRGGSGDGNN